MGFIDYLTKVIKKYLEHITNRARNIEITKTEYLSEKEAIDVLFTFECGDASMCDTLTIPTINLIKFHNKHNIDREKITMREWSRMCKRAFKPTENEDELVCRLNPGHTPFQDMVEAANERVLEKEKSLRKGIIFGDWDNLEKIYEEENNMRKTIYDVIIIDKKEDKVVEREESIVAADKTEALSKAGYYKVLEENDHDTKRFEAIITELYDYTSIEEE